MSERPSQSGRTAAVAGRGRRQTRGAVEMLRAFRGHAEGARLRLPMEMARDLVIMGVATWAKR